MDEKEISPLQSSSLKAIWNSGNGEDESAADHVDSIWNPLSTPVVKKPEPAVVDLQKMPQILTLEELERKLAAHHVEDEGEEVTDPQSNKSILSSSSDDATLASATSQEHSEDHKEQQYSEIDGPIVVSPIRTNFTSPGKGSPINKDQHHVRPPLIPMMYPPHMLQSRGPPGMPPFRHPLPPPPPPGMRPMFPPMWRGPMPPPPRMLHPSHPGHFMQPPLLPPPGFPPRNYIPQRDFVWNGFMTQKEKDWVLKIQFMQLQPKDASIDDYYYQNFVVRKKAKKAAINANNGDSGEVADENSSQLIIPTITREERSYQPAEFKDSLGRLKVSCVSNPRQTIDVDMSFEGDVADRPMNSKDIARKRKMQLGAIEKMYQLLLEIEDLNKKALALPDEERESLLSSKADMVSNLFKQFKFKGLSEVWKRNDDGFFKEMMYYRKGKRLVNRILPVLSRVEATVVIYSIMRNITALIRRDEKDMVLTDLTSSCCAVIESISLPVLCQLLSALLKGPAQVNPHVPAPVMAAKSEFSGKVLVKLLQRGQTLSKDTSKPEDVTAHLDTWNESVKELGGIIQSNMKLIPDSLLQELVQCNIVLQLSGHEQ